MLRTIEVVHHHLHCRLCAGGKHRLKLRPDLRKLGFPALGIRGAALATLLARLGEMVLVVYYTFRVQKQIKVKIRDFMVIDKTMVKDYLFYGLPVGITDAQWALIGLLKMAIIGRLGGAFMAANSIATSLYNLGTSLPSASLVAPQLWWVKQLGEVNTIQPGSTQDYSADVCGRGVIMASVVYMLRSFTSLYGSSRDRSL